MKVILIGCVKSSEIFLEKLVTMQVDISGVITKKDTGFNADYVDLGSICIKKGIEYIYVTDINGNESKKFIKDKKIDLLLCLGWSQLIGREILSIPQIGCIGFHPAELPYNRGRHPVIWALALGLRKTASTFFMMDENADTGDIISQEIIDIDYMDDAGTLYDKIMKKAVYQLEDMLGRMSSYNIKPVTQNKLEGNTWRKRGKKDGEIDWRMSSYGIYNLVRALAKPYVGVHFCYRGNEYKVWKVRELFWDNMENIEPGKVICVKSDTNFIVKVQDNLLEVLECENIILEEGVYL